MKKSRLAVLVAVGAVFLPMAVMPASAEKPKKPAKINVKEMTVTTSGAWPAGNDETYGVKVSFPYPAPTTTEQYRWATKFHLVCAPSYKGDPPPGAPLPSATLTKTWTLTAPSGRYTAPSQTGFSSTGSGLSHTIELTSPPYSPVSTLLADRQFPPLRCKVDVENDKGTTAGKAPKLPTSPSTNCGDLGDIPLDPVKPPEGSTLFLHVTVDAGLAAFPFCTTDSVYKPRFLVDQESAFTSKTKVKPKTDFAQVKKLRLTASVNTQIPLLITGGEQIYKFDPAVLQVDGGNSGCTAQLPKNGETTCMVNNSTGIITVATDQVSIVKPGKPIISPFITVNFSYAAAAATNLWTLENSGSANITFVSTKTKITIGTTAVDVVVRNGEDSVVDGLGALRAGGSDPNKNQPIVTFTGLY
jgi:hypothetical protein